MMIFPILYTTRDFLMDQKERIEELEEKLKKITNEERKALIRAQIEIYYQQGLEALNVYGFKAPKSVKDYFLGYRKDKPDFEEISSELRKMNYSDYQLTEKVILVAVITTIVILSIIAFFF